MFRVQEEFFDHPKLDPIRRDAYWWGLVVPLWAAAGCDARKRLSDGLVPRARLGDLPGPVPLAERIKAAEKLVELTLWERAGEDYRFHDWPDVQETKQQVQERRRRDRERQQAARDKARSLSADKASRKASRRESRKESRADSAQSHAVTPAGVLDGRDGWREGKDGRISSELRREADEELQDTGDGQRVMRAFAESPLLNIASGFAYVRWRRDWDEMAAKPADELAAVMRTLIAHPNWIKRWQSLSPAHLCKHWAIYVSGRLPAYSANADTNGNTSNGRRSFGMSEVGKPEDFANQEDD